MRTNRAVAGSRKGATKAATTMGRTLLGSMRSVNVVFVEPSFPPTQRNFVRGLAEVGATVDRDR